MRDSISVNRPTRVGDIDFVEENFLGLFPPAHTEGTCRGVRKTQSLPARARRAMELLSGLDLSALQICAASPLPAALGARAFAFGNQIHFAPGEYDLSTSEGWRVLGHEIAHVVQQCHGRASRRNDSRSLLRNDPELEREAEAAGDYAAQMFWRDELPCRPLRSGPNLPLRDRREAVVQCLMTADQFKTNTTRHLPRKDIQTIDAALADYNTANSGPIATRKFDTALAKLRILYKVCLDYKKAGGMTDTRRQGVDALIKQIALEEVILVPLAAFSSETDVVKKLDHLEQAQEYALQLKTRPDLVWKDCAIDIENNLIKNLNGDIRAKGPEAVATAVKRDLEEFKQLPLTRSTLPDILKSIIRDLTSQPYVVDSITYGIGSPSGALNKRAGATTRFILSHGPQSLGRKFRMGAMAHEMTHLRNADIYDNTVFMFAIPKTATDTEMLEGSRARKQKLQALEGKFQSDTSIDSVLRGELIAKCQYPIMGKFGMNYLGKMIELKMLTEEQKTRYRKLQHDGMDAELIEYDSVINQMALWCELSGVSRTNAGYVYLLQLAEEAYSRRAGGR